MTEITNPLHRERWRVQAAAAAAELKAVPNWGDKVKVKAGLLFDDAILRMTLEVALIQRLNEAALADLIFNAALELMQTDHRAAGDSADVQTSGMECGLAPQQDSAEQGVPLAGRIPAPAAAAVSEPCRRRPAPDTNCPNLATGGFLATLRPAQAVQKRYGRSSLMTLVIDLPICAECFPKATILEITDPNLRTLLGREAQRINQGFLVDWSETVLQHLPFDDPAYVALRTQLAKKGEAANDSQPAPAGPQQGAGDGLRQESGNAAGD